MSIVGSYHEPTNYCSLLHNFIKLEGVDAKEPDGGVRDNSTTQIQVVQHDQQSKSTSRHSSFLPLCITSSYTQGDQTPCQVEMGLQSLMKLLGLFYRLRASLLEEDREGNDSLPHRECPPGSNFGCIGSEEERDVETCLYNKSPEAIAWGCVCSWISAMSES